MELDPILPRQEPAGGALVWIGSGLAREKLTRRCNEIGAGAAAD